MAKYDHIGTTYNTTRRADPYLYGRMKSLLMPSPDKQYLDIGCGTGNYTIKFINDGMEFVGVDPSLTMLEKAQSRCPDSTWLHGSAEDIPVESNTLDGALVTLTTHHWTDLSLGFKEVSRVLKPGSLVVEFTSTPFQMESIWLREYFPKMMDRSAEVMPSFEDTERAMNKAGIKILNTEKYDVHEGLEDMFLLSGTFNPRLYLDPNFRQGISSFSAFSEEGEIEKGLDAMETDINSGRIDEVIESWKSDRGQYLFIQAVKF